jgi:hypothetical protein
VSAKEVEREKEVGQGVSSSPDSRRASSSSVKLNREAGEEGWISAEVVMGREELKERGRCDELEKKEERRGGGWRQKGTNEAMEAAMRGAAPRDDSVLSVRAAVNEARGRMVEGSMLSVWQTGG